MRARLVLLLTASIACSRPAPPTASEVRVGDTEAAVLRERGEPSARMEAFGETTWLYPDLQIEFKDGKVRSMETKRTGPPPVSSPADAANRSTAGRNNRVFVFLKPALYKRLEGTLSNYLRAMENDGFAPELRVRDWKTPEEIKSVLVENRGKGLIGSLLIGDLPYARVRRKNREEWRPSLLYYMDLDGTWTPGKEPGAFAGYPAYPGIVPEIWAGVVHTDSLDEDPAKLVRGYLERALKFRAGGTRPPRRALAFIDDEWVRPGPTQTLGLEAIYGERGITVLRDPAETTARRLREELAKDWEFVHVIAHGDPVRGIILAQPDRRDRVVGLKDLRSIAPKALFYNFGDCSLARFTMKNYAAGWIVFGPGGGLAGVGSTMSGMMIAPESFYADLGAGGTFGSSLVRWYEREIRRDKDVTAREWYLGVVLLGDPTLRMRPRG